MVSHPRMTNTIPNSMSFQRMFLTIAVNWSFPNQDIINTVFRMQGLERDKRYALQGSRWKEKDLTYRVSKYPVRSGLSRRQVDETMEKAFKIWEKAMPLKFTKQKSGKVHIDIRFERRSHGDKDSFDGRGGTLAHAFFPVYGGDVHIDDDEDWTVNTARGTSLLMTTTHELGHSLGLSHSNNRNSLMAPFYRIYEPNLALKTDDVRGIQSLYGRNTDTSRNEVGLRSFIPSSIPQTTKRTTKRTTQPTTRHPATTQRTFFNYRPTLESDSGTSFLCSRGQLDTLVTMKDSVTYAFLGSQYWKLTETSVEPGYPRSISSDWDGLPGDLDASFTYTNGKTYFFKGSNYWRFSAAGQVDPGYPRDISVGFPGIPNNLDAAFTRAANDKIYFFKDSRYWKFNPEGPIQLDASYPKPISNWDGVPNNLDSALQYTNGKSYFFKAGRYYRFDDSTGRVDDSARPSFPRETGFWWFGCQSRSSPFVAMITITG